MTALLFDCDGVIADTERHGHLPAFNQTFREFDLPVQWSEAEYGALLRIGGGKERMASLLTPAFVAEVGLPMAADEQAAEIARWHRRKGEIFVRMAEEGRLPARPGIARLARAADAAGWTLAVCSTSAEGSVRAILRAAVGHELYERFSVFAGDIVEHKKPAPDIYELALERLGLDTADVIVVEDSHNGLAAARAAGLTTIVTVNGYTQDEDFAGAALVVTSLGDPGGEISHVLADSCGAGVEGWVTLADVERCVRGG